MSSFFARIATKDETDPLGTMNECLRNGTLCVEVTPAVYDEANRLSKDGDDDDDDDGDDDGDDDDDILCAELLPSGKYKLNGISMASPRTRSSFLQPTPS